MSIVNDKSNQIEFDLMYLFVHSGHTNCDREWENRYGSSTSKMFAIFRSNMYCNDIYICIHIICCDMLIQLYELNNFRYGFVAVRYCYCCCWWMYSVCALDVLNALSFHAPHSFSAIRFLFLSI